MFKKNAFIQWNSKDADGTFIHKGQVISHKNGVITFTTKDGDMSVADTDGQFLVIKKPRNWSVKKVADAKKPVTKTKRAKRVAGAPTKKDQAIQIYRDLAGKGHGKDMTIQRFMDVLGMSKAGATTYFYNAKKNA